MLHPLPTRELCLQHINSCIREKDPLAEQGPFYVVRPAWADSLGAEKARANTMVDESGNQTNTRFLPLGETHGDEAFDDDVGSITERGFTDHREYRGIGLTYMNARYYVPGIGRFASADTIVPDPMNPQVFNRFSYVRNNPVNLVAPTGGHDEGAPGSGEDDLCWEAADQVSSEYGI